MPWLIGAAAFVAYAARLHATSLLTDEAKDILNIPYPHPPLIRTIMEFMSETLGAEVWAGRLPSALLGAASATLVCLILRRSVRLWIAATASLAYAFMTPQLHWAPSAFLSVPLAFFLLLGLLGASEIAVRPERTRGWWLMAAGFGLGVWTELQGACFGPVYLYAAWRHRTALLADKRLFSVWIFGLWQGVLLLAYVAGNPLIIADLITFVGTSSLKPGPYMTGWLLTAAVPVALSFVFRRRLTGPHLTPTTIIACTLLFFVLRNPADYYAPYLAFLLPLLAAPLAEAARTSAAPVLAALLVPCFLIPTGGINVPAFDAFISEHEHAWRTLLRDEKEVVVIGDYGYEMQYYLPTVIRKMPRTLEPPPGARIAFVFGGWDLSETERSYVARLEPIAAWGVVKAYRLPAIRTEPFSK